MMYRLAAAGVPGRSPSLSHIAVEFPILFPILAVNPDQTTRGIKESIYTRMLHPNLNADGGRYHLPPIWDISYRLP